MPQATNDDGNEKSENMEGTLAPTANAIKGSGNISEQDSIADSEDEKPKRSPEKREKCAE